MKQNLTKQEFAIKNGAVMKATDNRTIKIENDGRVTVTVTYILQDPEDTLLNGPQDTLEALGPCGVFNIDSSNNFTSGNINDISLKVIGNDQIRIKSNNLDMDVLTDGEKGDHGTP